MTAPTLMPRPRTDQRPFVASYSPLSKAVSVQKFSSMAST